MSAHLPAYKATWVVAFVVGGALYVVDGLCAIIIPVRLPMVLYIVGWLWGAGLIYWVQGKRPTRSWHVACGCLALWLLLVYWVPWSTRKSFLRDWSAITPGMHVTEVEPRLLQHSKCSRLDAKPYCATMTITDANAFSFPDELRALPGPRPFAVGVISYRHSHTAEYGNDVGMVYFVGDRVVCTEFHSD